ncbi:MAG: hypothetical protein HDT42_07075 [Ruminococcaceae bacterium]|nr:hypothetical protein [Oscillospiraceae bacterium]
MEKYNGILELFGVKNPMGYSPEEVEKAKREVGGLPLELEKFYLYYGNSPELHGLQDELVLPNRSKSLLNPDYILFFDENQGVCQAAVKKSDVGIDDPPVYTSTDDGGWQFSSPHVSDFLCAMFDYQASICLDFNPEDFFWITPEECAKVKKMFPKLGEFDKWLYDWKISVYGENGGRIAIMENGDIQMNYAANNEREYKRMFEMLDGIGEGI